MSGAHANILIIKLGAFGDVVLAEGAIRDIRAAHPDAQITVLTMPAYRKIMAANPHVDTVEVDTRPPRWRIDRMRDLRARLLSGRYERVYDLQNVKRTRVYHRWLSSQPGGVEWSGTATGASHPHRADSPKTIPVLDRLAGQLRDAGLDTPNCLSPDMSWMGEGREARIDAILAEAGVTPGFVLLVPGASARHSQKRWPNYAALAERLNREGYQTVTAPGPDEMDLCRALPATMLLDGDGFIDFFHLMALIGQCGYVVTNDTGPGHLAAWGRTRGGAPVSGLALFGSHVPASRQCIDRRFEVIQVADLRALDPEPVIERALAALG